MAELDNLSQRYIKIKGRGQTRNFYYRGNYDQRSYQNRYSSDSGDRRISLVVEYNMDKIIGIDQGIIKSIEVILEEETLEEISNQIGIIEDRIIEADTEEIIEMIIMKEVELGLGTDNIQIILEGMIETTVGLDQVQELA